MDLDPTLVDAIDRNNKSLMGRTLSPGMVFGVINDGKPALIRGYGTARLTDGGKEPVTADTVFRIASISKIFTAVCIMKLAEQGELSLDDPAEKHLKSFRIRKFKPADPPITIRHLLTHTAGIGEFAPLLGYLQPSTLFGVARKGRPLPPIAKLYRGELRPDRSPGVAWSYANHGYATLGQIIADVTGDPFEIVVENMILRPLEMDRSDFVRSRRVEPNQAVGYWKFRGKDRPVLDLDIMTLADGSLFTTANDFAKFLGTMASGGGGLISKDSLEQMLTPQFQLDENLPAMGLGFTLDDGSRWHHQRVAMHTGLWLGFHSAMLMAPDQRTATFAFANDGGDTAISAAENGMRQLLNDYRPSSHYQRAKPHPDSWPDLIGTYRPRPGFNSNFRLWVSNRLHFKVAIKDDRLVIRTRGGVFKNGEPLRPADASNRLVFYAGGRKVVFTRNGRGEIASFGMHLYEFIKQ